jgi:formylglycine-generating enzyme
VRVDDFFIDRFRVTNRQFAAFAAATGYRTVAEQRPDPVPSGVIRKAEAVP